MNKRNGIGCAASILLVVLIALAVPVVVQAQDYQFKINGNAITIIKYTGSGGVVTIRGLI